MSLKNGDKYELSEGWKEEIINKKRMLGNQEISTQKLNKNKATTDDKG